MARRVETIPYKPRAAFKPFHNRTERWACLVAHRRAGKTVAAINDIIRAALMCKTESPLFAYIAPFRSQAKSVAWDYIKRFAAPVLASSNEAELTVELITGAKIRLFGADNADAMRGVGLDGVFMDEYGDFRPSVWGNVIRPLLSDKQGWAVFAGTPKGKNQFWDIYETARRTPDEWFHLVLKASESGLLPEAELKAAAAQISQDQFLQEFQCSFEAAIVGAFYGEDLRKVTEAGQVRRVDYDPHIPTHTAWDLGYRDDTAIWWYQVVRNEIHVIDYFAISGANIAEIAKIVVEKPYIYGKHYLPHDARAKTLAAAGKSVIEQLSEYLGINNMAIVPDLSVQDGIQAVRQMLPMCWFDAERTHDGLEALRQYQREYDEDKKAFRQTPRHDWCFTGDTMVLTRYGTQQIMNLPNIGEVLTSCGWKQYTNPRVTRKNAQLVQVEFANGYSVKCTPDHLFKTVNGWVLAENLTKGSQILSSLTRLRNISMAVYTVYGQVTNTFQEVVKSCIEMFGDQRSVLFQMAVTSITKTATLKTTSCTTLNVYPQKYIFQKHGTPILKKDLINPLEIPQQHGINQMKAGYGTNDTQLDNNFGQKTKEKKSRVYNAMCYLWHWLENQQVCKSIAQRLVKLKRIGLGAQTKPQLLDIESVKKLNQTDDVWCLTVPNANEFSLANGAIVHNCSHPADAFRMLAIAWRLEPKVKAPDTIKPLMVGPENTVTLNDMWATHTTQRSRRL